MRIVGEKNTVHIGIKVKNGLTLEDCHGVTLDLCVLKGGFCNLRLLNCTDVIVRNCLLAKPNGKPDEDGNGPHNVLFDGCTDCKIVGAKIERWARSEMGVGIYKSIGCVVDNCEIVGPSSRQSADAITFDWGSKNCTASNNKIDLRNARKTKPMGHSAIVVASGSGHRLIMGTGWIQGSREEFPVAVTSYYDADGNSVEDDDVDALPVSVREMSGFDLKAVYVGPHGKILKG